MNDLDDLGHPDGIAIIGMACRFPGAKSIDEFWRNLRDGAESITFFSDKELEETGIDPALLSDPEYVKAWGMLDNIALFDASFFGISPREAEIMAPQNRLFLECAWEGLESAGYNSETYKGLIGVYAGIGKSTYLLNNLLSNPGLMESVGNLQTTLGNDRDFVSTLVSYRLNLKGPSFNVQTACSTSLVAVHLACQSLLNGECDMALTGGASIATTKNEGYYYQEGGILSPDGHCRAFDARAMGTVGGNGVGIVVLKRLADALEDGDCIHAVIKGSAINNDGSSKVGFTAPSVDGQARVIAEALAIAGVNPETVTYVETHGIGIALSDPIEIAALTQVFHASTKAKGFCAIGSVKTNIGHVNAAAGVASLIKTVLALEHKQVPASLHFEKPNPQIDWENIPFFVTDKLCDWETDKLPRRAGVSSFGIGGTNAHVILEEAPTVEVSGNSRPRHLLVLSARTSSALEIATANLVEHLKRHPDLNLADVAYTCQVGRKAFSHCRMLVCHDHNDAVTALETLDPKRVSTAFQEPCDRPVVFMFTGQGAHYANMGLELYEVESTFREQVDICSELLKADLGIDLRHVLYPSENKVEEATERLNQTYVAQPALFVIEYALAKLWMEWGVRPQAMISHGIGEYVAACLAGVFRLEDALALVTARGRLMQKLPGGAMLAVPLPEKEVRAYLGKKLTLAAINGPSLCVVLGHTDAVDQLEDQLAEKGLGCHRLHASHTFHSEMMDSILKLFTEEVRNVRLNSPKISYISSVTGTWITAAEAMDADYWAKHLHQTVRFSEGMQELLKEPDRVLLEVGPGQTLSTLAMQHANKTTGRVILSSLGHPLDRQTDISFLLSALGRLWMAGIQVNWSAFYEKERRHRIRLPTYPFERQRHWVEPPREERQVNRWINDQTSDRKVLKEAGLSRLANSRPELANDYVAPRSKMESIVAEEWQDMLGIDLVSVDDNFFDLGGHSLLAVQVIARLKKKLGVHIALNFRDFIFQNLGQIASVCDEQTNLRPESKPVSAENKRPKEGGIEPFYFRTSSKPLFGCYHALGPEICRDCGVVLCYPVGDEYIRFHRAYKQLAVHLSKIGFPVLRFDYYGCGDSGGDCEQGDVDIDQWCADISTAIDTIRQRCGVEKVCLVGFRLGGALSMIVGAARGDIDGVVLCDPVVSGADYIEEVTAWHQDLLRHAHVKQEGVVVGENLTEILGFTLTNSLLEDIENIDVLAIEQRPANKILVIESHEETGEGRLMEYFKRMDTGVTYQHRPNPELWRRSDRFWLEDVTRVLVPHEILQSVVSWISERYQ